MTRGARWALWSALVLVTVGLGGWFALMAILNRQEPPRYACSAQMSVTGRPLPGQVALVKCYVRAIEHGDARLLSKIATDPVARPLPTPNVDASSARARFFDFDTGMGDQRVTITFADGQTVTLQLGEAPSGGGDPAPWRLQSTP